MAENDLSAWASETHTGDQDGVLNSQPAPAPAFAAIWRVNHWLKQLCLSLIFSVTLALKLIKWNIFLRTENISCNVVAKGVDKLSLNKRGNTRLHQHGVVYFLKLHNSLFGKLKAHWGDIFQCCLQHAACIKCWRNQCKGQSWRRWQRGKTDIGFSRCSWTSELSTFTRLCCWYLALFWYFCAISNLGFGTGGGTHNNFLEYLHSEFIQILSPLFFTYWLALCRLNNQCIFQSQIKMWCLFSFPQYFERLHALCIFQVH